MRRIESSFLLRAPEPARFRLLALPTPAYGGTRTFEITHDGQPVEPRVEPGRHGQQELIVDVPAGDLGFALTAEIDGTAPPAAADDSQRYLASSRYIDTDAVAAFASERFGGAQPRVAVEAIVRWIARSFDYRPELSAIDDSATDTLHKSGGMCRDYAHVTIALCRALGIPARYVSVYAPHLTPQDFHAVAEVFIDDAWWLVDATFLAPRAQMVRIATGLDASETAWATNTGSGVKAVSIRVHADSDGDSTVEGSDVWTQLT